MLYDVFVDETDLMGLLQFVMGDMVTELDEAQVRNAENSTEQREAYNVVDDEGSPAPKLPSGKVSLEHICLVFRHSSVQNTAA